jgi:hypothetical protein
MNPPLIFLDIDGVLNSDNTDFDPDTAPLDPLNIGPFNRIIAATGAKIVVTSTWRFFTSLENIASYFAEASIEGEIIGMTPDLRGGDDPPIEIEYTRGEEIYEWLKKQGEEDPENCGRRFVILDDRCDIEPFLDRHIMTRSRSGLVDAEADRAIEMLQ